MELKFAVKLSDCPPGLFVFENYLGFKSEYRTTNEPTGLAMSDAYVVESGEYFQGGAKTAVDRENLLVTPVEITRADALRPVHIETET